ncbi:tRNA (adenosine(37)-N6)-threonylcarbamoyltransferase complex dimerization subunit type 1 TsaB [Gracilibacillus salinarum]|uniref:tRNA (Adenosine(37)-N6)-threonylcarbamoyltransferase complex dimerization subunit type 1 TsaB n=1 Tax=Gracilibacillus salinarum TaxID=2932255 RepID=A0ABY4GIX8_9BACI|nr:tRNA (adenosine(37)-N6)-threonylcarbamoyltransferase complex dimerization subunit type 1 TsaB [Gracilibacillus salinarum]UOQ84310.1 tRNA (adenosine(37)-N6)-threonylcarbamoyltransferase complex dimerization subunit type 1 TsaB [Gracilibacillus salinarum]
MNVLAIDTSNQILGVAVSSNGAIKAEYTANVKRNHSIGLMPAIDYVMNQAGLSPDQLDRIAVAKGPGSYTGVRIGLATAKTMAWTLQIPIVAISSLALLAHNARYAKMMVSPFFDARRGLVYTGLYEYQQGHLQELTEDQNILMEQWLEDLKQRAQPVLFLSQDLDKHQELIQEKLGDYAHFPYAVDNLPRPGVLALLAADYQESHVHELTPNYIRLVEAEANWLKEQEKNV